MKNYFSALLGKGLREDGRKQFDYRDITIEINPLSKPSGSARVKIGETEVLVGVTMDVGTPYPDSPNDGNLMVNAELPPSASAEFESGPPREDAIEIARVVDRGIRESHSIDTAKLCITPGEKVWTVIVDIHPVNDAGNLLDAAGLAAIVALKNAVLPKYDKKTEQLNQREKTKTKLPINETPIMCTFGKIDGKLFADPTSREEEAFDARLSIATTEKGLACAMQKGGEGSLTADEVLELFDMAVKKGKELRKLVK